MKGIIFTISLVLLLASCQDKAVKMISRRWDCVKIENLQPIDTKFQSREDSVKAIQIQNALLELNWTFTTGKEYRCSIADRTTTSGTYTFEDNGKILTLTPSTANNINSYSVRVLTEQELQLANMVNGTEIIMHFRPH